MGGPQTPTEAKLIAGQIQFMQGGTLGAFDAVANNVPLITVAAIFQKDPQAILAHPDQALKRSTIWPSWTHCSWRARATTHTSGG